jgi:hypothetical protein
MGVGQGSAEDKAKAEAAKAAEAKATNDRGLQEFLKKGHDRDKMPPPPQKPEGSKRR